MNGIPGGADRDRFRPIPRERCGGGDDACDDDRGGRSDARAAVDEAPERPRVARTLGDRHEPHGRDVHAEPRAGGGDEGDLDGDRDEREAARGKRAPEQHLDAEGGRDAGQEAGNVGNRAVQEDALVAHGHSVASRSAGVTRGSRGRATAPRPRAPRPR